MKHIGRIRTGGCLLIGCLAFLSTLAPMASAKVKVFPAKNFDVSTFKTYSWLPIRIVTKQGFLEDDPDVSPLIRAAVDRELATKGYTRVADGGELTVLAAGLAVASSQLEGFMMTWGFDIYWGYGVSAVSPVTRVNEQGTIIVSFLEAKSEKGVWTGISSRSLHGRGGVQTSIDRGIKQLIKKLPASKR